MAAVPPASPIDRSCRLPAGAPPRRRHGQGLRRRPSHRAPFARAGPAHLRGPRRHAGQHGRRQLGGASRSGPCGCPRASSTRSTWRATSPCARSTCAPMPPPGLPAIVRVLAVSPAAARADPPRVRAARPLRRVRSRRPAHGADAGRDRRAAHRGPRPPAAGRRAARPHLPGAGRGARPRHDAGRLGPRGGRVAADPRPPFRQGDGAHLRGVAPAGAAPGRHGHARGGRADHAHRASSWATSRRRRSPRCSGAPSARRPAATLRPEGRPRSRARSGRASRA